jgi:hypothetical protein
MAGLGTQISESAPIEGLDFGQMPDTLDSIQNVQFVEYRPPNPLTAGNVINIFIPDSGDYNDLSRSMMISIKFKVKNAPDIDLVTDDFINNMLSALWSQLEVYLNGMLVSPNVNLFPYTVMFKRQNVSVIQFW